MILLARIERELLLFLQEGEYFFEYRKKWKKKEKIRDSVWNADFFFCSGDI